MYFIQAQKAKNDWWRYAFTLCMIVFVLLLANPFYTHHLFYPGTDPLSTNQNLVIQLLPAVLAFFFLWFAMQLVHHRKSGYIVSARGRIRWNRLIGASLLWLTFLLAAEVIFMHRHPGNYSFHFNAREFFPLLMISLLMIPFQAGFEELLFRSYLMTGLGQLFRSRWAALLLTAGGFGALHLSNPEVSQFGFWETMPYYVGFGIFAGILVIYDNGIELAIGVHAMNNIYSALLMNYDSSVLNTASLWTIRETKPLEMMLAFFVMAILFIFIMAKVYGWDKRNKLFQGLPRFP